MVTTASAAEALRNEMVKRGKEEVSYKPAQCCFNCAGFIRPYTAGVVLGHCMRVKGEIHPADTCDRFQWAEHDDDDGDGRPHDCTGANASQSSERDAQLRAAAASTSAAVRFFL